MGRKPGLSSIKISRIMGVLIANNGGIWVREIARQTGYTHATVARYLNTSLKPLLIDESLGKPERPLLRVVRLKPFVLERLQEGKSLDQVMRMLKMFESVQ